MPTDDGRDAANDTGATVTADRFSVSGVVLDLEDQPVVDVFVTISTEFCIPDRTDDSGAFTVDEVDVGEKRLITYGETASNGLFASVVFAFDANEAVAFPDPIHTPEFQERWAVDPAGDEEQVVYTTDGLVLSIPPGSLTLAPFAPAEVQVARVPLSAAPPLVAAEVVLTDLFALGPIQSTFDPPAPVSFPADPDLKPGAPVVIHSLDYDTGQMVPVATGTVDADHHPVTDPGQGVPELTWVGVSLDQTCTSSS